MLTQGTLVRVTEATMTGTRETLGRVTRTLHEGERLTAVTVEGMVTTETVRGLPQPIETETPITLEWLPAQGREGRLTIEEL